MDSKPDLTHTDAAGRVHMVNVSAKAVTTRRAVASAVVTLGPEVYERLTRAGFDKGNVLTTAKLAGVMAAKRTPELIPLCHGLSPEYIDVQIELRPPDAAEIRAEACVEAKTGVEMEAMVAASVAALTIYDMCKAVSKSIEIGPIRLEHKSGGKSGTWERETSC